MNAVPPAAVIVLAAGEGTRMKSQTPKVLHPIGGLPLLGHAIRAARATASPQVAVVVRHQRDLVVEFMTAFDLGKQRPGESVGRRGHRLLCESTAHRVGCRGRPLGRPRHRGKVQNPQTVGGFVHSHEMVQM